MKTLLLLFIGLFLIKTTYAQKSRDFHPSFTLSKKTTHKINKDQQFTFGYLEVLENRSNPESSTIKIPVYIFKSRSAHPKADPIIYTVGGPGYTTMTSAKYMNYYQYLDDRDFILIEQRGNYYAKPHLDCPEWAKALYLSNQPDFDTNQSDSLFKQAASACRERLVKKKIDLNGYNTNEIAADIADLVKVLGLKEFNLLTISYSTKIAQVLMRDYPQGIRSVVMDSPLPLEVNYDEESVGNILESIDLLLTDCHEDPDCSSSFPNLKERFFEYLREKSINPLLVSILDPKNGQEEIFKLRGEDLITVFTSASTSEVVNIPLEINKILNDDLSTVKKQLAYLFEDTADGSGLGMRLSVWCAEEFPFDDQRIIETETHKYPEVDGLSPAVFDAAICQIWAVKKVAEIENKAINSDIPVLLISGEYDNETPPKWASNMQKNLSNSYHLIFKGWKHTPTTNWGNPCAMQAAHDFFNTPTQLPNPTCFDEIKAPKFKVN